MTSHSAISQILEERRPSTSPAQLEFLVSHDRALVLEAARSLLSKLIPLN
jgi:hypothetical protein